MAKSKTAIEQWEVSAEQPLPPQVAGEEEEFTIVLPDGRLFGRTRDYTLFEFDPANRPIDPNNLKRKIKQNLKKDLLPANPIAVVDKGGRWLVRDGQHRLRMAEANGRFIYFIVDENFSGEDVADINEGQSRWTTANFLHHWATSGKVEYRKLQEFIDRHSWLKINTAKDLASYGDRKKQDFSGGAYVANDLEFAEAVARACEQWAGLIDWWGETTFVYAIAMAHEHEGFSHDRLLRKARLLIGALHKCVSVVQYMEMLDEVYNHQMREGSRLRLERLNSNSSRRRSDRRYRRQRGKDE